jgi:hypothetical protein
MIGECQPGTAPGLPEAYFRHLPGYGICFQSCVEVGLGFCGRDLPDGLEEAAIVEPVDPFEGCTFHGIEAAPWIRRWMTSALNRPLIVSASALS